MIKRRVEKTVAEYLRRSPAVALLGPRQVGKTTIALNLAEKGNAIYLDLERRLDLEKVKDIESFHSGNQGKLLIFDEVQRLPDVFAPLRGIIDQERRKGNKTGQFLFLGSASIELLQQASESLAGRIAYVELYPIDLLEFDKEDADAINTLWLRGGFPESLLASSDKYSIEWRRDFIRTYLERDVPLLGPRIPAETLERFWTMLAHNQGSVMNAAHLARNLDVSAVTIARYLDLMVDLLLVRRLQPWTFNVGKRLIKSPKIYVRDSGITHALLNIGKSNDLAGHPVVGGSWEGFVIENLLSVINLPVRAFYYGTPAGAEIDLILEFGLNDRWAIEIKRSSLPVLSKGFYEACDVVKPDQKYVVYSGNDEFAIGKDVTAISLKGLMKLLLKKQ